MILTDDVVCSALTDGWQNFHRLIRPDVVGQMNGMFEQGKPHPICRTTSSN